MATKRDYSDLDEGEVTDDDPSPKRAKKLTGAQPRRQHQHSAIDPTWGQKYVFSNLEDGSSIPFGEEDDFEDDGDAMAYLRSVRLEATGIPHLLVAPKRQIGPQLPPELQPEHDDDEAFDRSTDTNGVSDARGYYEDGAYVGLPNSEDGHVEGEAGDVDPERELLEAYCASVLSRYHRLRSTLHAAVPPDAARRLSCARPTFAPPLGGKSSTPKIWSQALRSTDPHPLQLALMSKESVLRVLRVLLGGKFLHRGYTLSERTSQWLWGLLARLPDPWEMDHTDIGWVRDLGRRAVLLGRSLSEMAALRDELEEGMLGGGVDASSSSGDDDDDDDAEAGEDPGSPDSEPQKDPARDAVSQEEPTGENVAEEQAGAEQDEEGQVGEGIGDNESVAMDLGSESERGEATEDDGTALEAARKAFLSRLEDAAADNEQPEEDPREAERLRLRMNMRATLNMILTVAGEFYGQRDLLEFREPFVGM